MSLGYLSKATPAVVIFIDGIDNVGKSTIVDSVIKNFNKYHLQYFDSMTKVRFPSEENSLGFLRKRVKSKSFNVDPLSRQLLHTVSHIDSMYSEILHSGCDSVICDRSPWSGLPYLVETTGTTYYNLIRDINTNAWFDIAKKFNIVTIYIHLKAPTQYGKDNDFYSNLDSVNMVISYDKVVNYLPSAGKTRGCKHTYCTTIFNYDIDKTVESIYNYANKILDKIMG